MPLSDFDLLVKDTGRSCIFDFPDRPVRPIPPTPGTGSYPFYPYNPIDDVPPSSITPPPSPVPPEAIDLGVGFTELHFSSRSSAFRINTLAQAIYVNLTITGLASIGFGVGIYDQQYLQPDGTINPSSGVDDIGFYTRAVAYSPSIFIDLIKLKAALPSQRYILMAGSVRFENTLGLVAGGERGDLSLDQPVDPSSVIGIIYPSAFLMVSANFYWDTLTDKTYRLQTAGI